MVGSRKLSNDEVEALLGGLGTDAVVEDAPAVFDTTTFITAEEIQLGLEAGEFYYAVQPIWDVEARRIEGFEALIRWQKADGTVL